MTDTQPHDPKPTRGVKTPYKAPHLSVYGDIRTLTSTTPTLPKQDAVPGPATKT